MGQFLESTLPTMTSNTFLPQYPHRLFEPVTTDTSQRRVQHPDSSQLRLMNPKYENLSLKDLRDEKHQYEDPMQLSDQVRVLQAHGDSRGPRRKYNDLYEPHQESFKVRLTDSESSDGVELGYSQTPSCINRCLLALVLVLSLVSLIIMILMLTGRIGPQASCGCQISGETE